MIENFFIWCSGAKMQILDECPIEKGKFVGMGMAVFFVSLLSVVSATFFITYAIDIAEDPEIKWPYVLVGLLWGIIIFTIDRNIITTIRKDEVFKKQFNKAIPRIILAVFIGLVISTPLEIKIFEKEINAKLPELIKNDKANVIQGEIKIKMADLSQYEADLKSFDEQMKTSYQHYIDEINGKISKQIGLGKKALGYKKEYDDYQGKRDIVQLKINNLRIEISNLNNSVSLESITSQDVQKFAGMEKRVIALWSLGGFHILITVLFIMLEVLPLLVKLMTPKGPYDEVLQRIEYEYFIDQKRIISDKNSEINRLLEEINQITKLKSDTRISIQKSKLDIEIKTNESLLNDIAQKQATLAKIAVKKWYDSELAKLKQDKSYQYAKSKAIPLASPSIQIPEQKISDVFWRQKGSVDKIEYFFRNGSLSNNELLYIENENLNKGKWSFNGNHDEIIIEVLNNKIGYKVSELNKTTLKLMENGTTDYLEFEKI